MHSTKKIKKICKNCLKNFPSREIGKRGFCDKCTKLFPHSNIKLKVCKFCLAEFPTSLCRKGICKNCSKKGFGRKSQGKIISEKYKGENNPNYTNGKSKRTLRQENIWKKTKKEYFENIKSCELCNHSTNLHCHHILPWTLYPNLRFTKENLIALCPIHHKELHRQVLDLKLLPNLFLYKQDVHQLKLVFLSQPEVQLLQKQSGGYCKSSEILKYCPKNYRKWLQNHHPEFFQQEFSHFV